MGRVDRDTGGKTEVSISRLHPVSGGLRVRTTITLYWKQRSNEVNPVPDRRRIGWAHRLPPPTSLSCMRRWANG